MTLLEKIRTNAIYIVLVLYAIIAILTIIVFDGTGDAGDSIHHYLFARYAPVHPELFFNHWAKPLYVLLVSPFAQFGFAGIKVFNAIVSLLTIFFTFKIAQRSGLENAILVTVISIFSPLYFALTFSGLTEPLFALFISISLYAAIRNNYIAACIIVSFLPFVRSEGLIIIGIYGLYFLIKREWRMLPLLLAGHVVYSVAGFFIYHDLLWIFNKIPYVRFSSIYGSGELFHMTQQLMYVIGIPIYILFWIGIISIMWKIVKKKINLELQVLVLLGFLSFFIAHTLFWYLGIFNSMGLKRVLIGIMPLISIISLMGFNFLTEDFFRNKRNPRLIVQSLLIAYILIFPFTANPAAMQWERDMKLSIDQQSAIQTGDYISKNMQYEAGQRFIFAHPYLSEVLKIDHFDNNKRLELTRDCINLLNPGDIIIWENWFAVVEHQVTKEYLDNNSGLVNICNSKAIDNGREILYSVYKSQ
jgi:hypothetical protein